MPRKATPKEPEVKEIEEVKEEKATEETVTDASEEVVEETHTDEDGVIVNLSDIKKEKSVLIEVYNELDRLTMEELDKTLESVKKEIQRHIKTLSEIEEQRNQRFALQREQDIVDKQRVTKDHYIDHKPEIEREADEPSLPFSEVLKLVGIVGIAALLIVIICLLTKK